MSCVQKKRSADALDLAGGILPAAALQHIEVQRLVAHEKRTMLTLDISASSDPDSIATQLSAFKIQDGDQIHIFPIAPYNESAIYLQGHVLRPGRYSYSDDMKVTDLLRSYSDLLPEPAAHYAEIVRLNPPDYHPSVESFDLAAALANPATAPKLQAHDTIRVFGRYDFEPAPQVWVGGEVASPGKYATSGQVRLRDAIYLAGGVSPNASLDSAQLFRTQPDGTLKILSVNLGGALGGNPTDNLLLEPRDRLLVHRNVAQVDPAVVDIKGEVAKPGRYPLTTNMHVEDLIQVAGGLKRTADSVNANLTRYSASDPQHAGSENLSITLSAAMAGDTSENKLLRDGDVLTIPQNPGWNDVGASATVRGEVQHPGPFGIRPGERVSSLLERAGGFGPQAYPYGAVLMRREVRELEMNARARNDSPFERGRNASESSAGSRCRPAKRQIDSHWRDRNYHPATADESSSRARGDSHSKGSGELEGQKLRRDGSRRRCAPHSQESGLHHRQWPSFQSHGGQLSAG